MKVISIDIGATSGRVMCVTHADHQFSYEESFRFPNRTYYDESHSLRWDFKYLFSNILTGLKIALEKNPDASSVSIDTWAVDYGLLQNGVLKKDPLCYRDTASFIGQKEVLGKISFSDLYQSVGIQNLHFNTIYQLAVEKQNWDEVDILLMIPDLIAYYLTGNARIEETNLSTTSLYSYSKKQILDSLLDIISVPKRIFPKIIHPGEIYGFIKEEFHLKQIPVIACCSHDTASAVLGTDGLGKFAYISSGTWSLIGTELKEPILTEESKNFNFTNEIGYQRTIRYLKNTMGMFLINEVRNDFKIKGNEIKVGQIAHLVEEAKDIPSYLDVNDPLFETPDNMIAKIDEYLKKSNQEPLHSAGEYFKVIYKSMALAYQKIIKQLEKLCQTHIESIHVVGGGNQAVILNQYTADVCNIKVQTGPSEATVLGNALAQFLALGDVKDVIQGRKEISSSTIEKEFYPSKDRDYWEKQIINYNHFLKKE